MKLTPEEKKEVDRVTAVLAGERYYLTQGTRRGFLVRDTTRPNAVLYATNDYDEALTALAALRGSQN